MLPLLSLRDFYPTAAWHISISYSSGETPVDWQTGTYFPLVGDKPLSIPNIMLAGFQSSLLAVGVSSLFLLAAAQIPSQQYGMSSRPVRSERRLGFSRADGTCCTGYNPSDQLYGGKQDIDLEKVCALYGVRETGPIKVIVEDAFGRRYGNYYGCISAEGKWVTKCPSLEVYHDSSTSRGSAAYAQMVRFLVVAG